MRERDARLMTMRTATMMIIWKTRESIEMMTRWMILMRLIVVIFSIRKILSMNLIYWIADRLIERFEVQLRMIIVYLMIEKMRIAVWLIEMMMIAVWLTRKIVVWLIEMKIVVWCAIFLCSEIELMIELIVLELNELIVREAMILIFVIQIVIVSVTNNL
jgi:hypothetical protein